MSEQLVERVVARLSLRWWVLVALLLAGLMAALPARSAERVELFVREGCPHCAQAEAFMKVLQGEQPALEVVVRDVLHEPAALQRLQELASEHGGGAARVPAIFVGGQLFIGYSTEARTDRLIRSALAGQQAVAPGQAASAGETCEADDGLSCRFKPSDAPPAEPEPIELDFFGWTLDLDRIGLPLFSIAIGLLDGFNPCSMWVLLLMISILAPLNDRRRMLAIAGTFVVIQGLAYFVFMAAWLNLFLLIGLSRASQWAIALIALVAGVIHVKDFFAFGRGISLSIPDRAKPGIYQRMRGLLHAPTLGAAIVGAIVLAVLVQFVELLCTSGFPALFTRILTLRELDTAAYYGYMGLYIGAYMLDDVMVLGTGVVLLSRHRLQEREGRWLKLISGLVMIGLAVYLVMEGM